MQRERPDPKHRGGRAWQPQTARGLTWRRLAGPEDTPHAASSTLLAPPPPVSCLILTRSTRRRRRRKSPSLEEWWTKLSHFLPRTLR